MKKSSGRSEDRFQRVLVIRVLSLGPTTSPTSGARRSTRWVSSSSKRRPSMALKITIDDFMNFFRSAKGMVAFNVNTLSLIEKSFEDQGVVSDRPPTVSPKYSSVE